MQKLLAPIYLPGQEPMPAGTTPEEREEMQNVQRWQKYATMGMESCPVKVGMSAGAGEFGCGTAVWNVV
jgi:import inner membrane translocase subunit TIM22